MDKIRKLKQETYPKRMGVSGEGMDRRVEKKASLSRVAAIAAAVLLVAVFAWWFIDSLMSGRSLSINSERITVSDVTVGTFEDFIPLRGRLVPSSTVYLDAAADPGCFDTSRPDRVTCES